MTTTATPVRTAATLQRIDLALILLRVVIGVIFIAHGYQKLFIYTVPGTTASFTQMGVPLAGLVAPATTLLELVGGAALIAGLGTRIAATFLALDMLGALALVHLKAGFFNPNGVEFPLTLLAVTVALALTGAGTYAIDARRPERI